MEIKKGFTLIELIIVIAIIGVLAAVVIFVSISAAKEKARIGRLMQFSNSVKGQLSEHPHAWWKFETKNGIITPDVWGNNNGILQGTADIVGGGANGEALDLSDTSSSIRNVEINPSATLPDNLLSSGDWTIEMWVKFREGGENVQTVFATWNSTSFQSHMRILVRTFWNDMAMDGIFLPETSTGRILFVTPRVVTYNNWHHIVLVSQNIGVDEANYSFYYDADEVRISITDKRINDVSQPIDKFVIGGVPAPGGNNFEGQIDEVRIYRQALVAEEVRRHYIKETPKYKMTLK
ncbi:LamG domain-containing protein [Patescibacteria group bacterium]